MGFAVIAALMAILTYKLVISGVEAGVIHFRAAICFRSYYIGKVQSSPNMGYIKQLDLRGDIFRGLTRASFY